jgi:RimJ/RimL family protein N-acetyltransferase
MADEERWLDRVTMSPNHKVFAIQADVAGTSRHIGNCGFHDIDLRQQHAVFGILIGAKELWGQGYGTEATEVLLRAGFYELNLHRIALDVIADNARARRSYEKIGFVLEGTKRQDCFREGRFRDVHLMSMLRDEYTAKYGAPR